MNDVEVVKKGYLRDRLRAHSNSKSSWFVFRIGSSASGRILDIYNSEKESTKKNAIAKDRIYLREIHSVMTAGNDDRKVFYLTCLDGSVQNCLEAPSEFECCEWVFALNAVLFGKGSNGRNLIQFAINIHRCSQYSYNGNGILEVRDDSLIVWSQGETMEIVRWKLGHLRSFKAKSGVLEIIAGSRSSTGEGVFTFGTQESVLITHTLETVIDRLARLKRAKTTKLQQALPPIPRSQPPTTLLPSIGDPNQSHMVPPPSPSGNVTLVRGRTDTKNLIPEFSDIPDGSVRLSKVGYNRSVHQSRMSVPDVQQPSETYNKLHGSNSHKSVSSGDLLRTKRDIYTSEVDDINTLRQSSRSSMQGYDYSYVETEPKCVLLSPTDEKSLVLGEIRHAKSMKEKRLSVSPTVVTSDYSEADEYSSLNPVDVTSEFLPQGLYNQLNFSKVSELEQTDSPALSDVPPPLPPPPLITTPVTKGYENIGTHSLPRIHHSSQTGLTDSAGSLEFYLEGSDSPKFTKKSKSPSASPRQSPRSSPRPPVKVPHKSLDDSALSRSSAPYDKVTRISVKPTNTKHFEIGPSEGSTYSTLSGRKQDPSDTIATIESPYSQLSRNIVIKEKDENNYSQLSTGLHTNTKQSDDSSFDDGSYSTFSRSDSGRIVSADVNQLNDPELHLENPYSTLKSSQLAPSIEHPNSSQHIMNQNLEYEEVEHVEKVEHVQEVSPINSHAYDQVDFSGNQHSSITPSIYGDVDEQGDNTIPSKSIQKPVEELTASSLNTPPVPPRRGASMNHQVTRKPPPPVKPKPIIIKQ